MTKRFISLFLAVAMILALGVSSFADTAPKGSITINNASKNRTYTLYKLFDATFNGKDAVAYKLASGTNMETSEYFTITDSKEVFIKDAAKESGTDFLSQGAVEYLRDRVSDSNKVNEITGNGKSVKFENLDYGFYFVKTSAEGAAVSINSVVGDVVIYDKNTDNPGPAPKSPTDSGNKPFKSVKVENDYLSNTTADAGSKVQFTVTFEATSYYNIVKGIEDFPEFFSESDIKENISKDAEENYLPIKAYVVKDIPSEDLEVNWNNLSVKVGDKKLSASDFIVSETDCSVTIDWAVMSGTDFKESKYESPVVVELTYEATMPVGTATNSVEISCSCIDGENEEILPVKEKSDEPDVSLANYKVSVTVSPTDANGASYKLYKTDTNGNKLYYTETNGVVSWTKNPEDAKVATEFVGLAEGEYFVEEVTSPKGYNNIPSDVKVEITNKDETVTINYKKGVRLPSTGGIGTKVFYVFGGILLAVAAALYVYKKKMSAQQ